MKALLDTPYEAAYDLFYEQPRLERRSAKARFQSSWGRTGPVENQRRKNSDFRCVRCQHYVSAHPLLAGVNNRNHCPYCLWSRHMDLEKAGDRLSACKSPMRPVGLTLKQTHNKYRRERDGELMLIHACDECGKVAINRIAADDDIHRIEEVFHGSFQLDPRIKKRLEAQGIRALTAADRQLVKARLLGE